VIGTAAVAALCVTVAISVAAWRLTMEAPAPSAAVPILPGAQLSAVAARPVAPNVQSAARATAAEPAQEERVRAGAQPLSRKNVRRVMLEARPALLRCAAGQHGELRARLVIDSAGRVSQARTRGDFAGGDKGPCLTRVLRRLRFPPSSQASLDITFPYRL